MKSSFSELILALTLVVNPVAMQASVLHGAHLDSELSGSMVISHETGQAADQPMAGSDHATHCGVPCCDDSGCRSLQANTCTLHHSPVLAAQEAQAIAIPEVDRKPLGSPTRLSDRDVQPEIPPPKHH